LSATAVLFVIYLTTRTVMALSVNEPSNLYKEAAFRIKQSQYVINATFRSTHSESLPLTKAKCAT